jgi:hypothetical protein
MQVIESFKNYFVLLFALNSKAGLVEMNFTTESKYVKITDTFRSRANISAVQEYFYAVENLFKYSRGLSSTDTF